MKTRKILAIALIAIMFLTAFVGVVQADSGDELYDELYITSNESLRAGSGKPHAEDEYVEVGRVLQLYAYHNERRVSADHLAENNTIGVKAENVTWASSDTSVATISATGIVTGVKAGTTIISATGNTTTPYTAELLLTVKAASGTEQPSNPEPTVEFTDFSNVTFELDDFKRFTSVNIIFKNFTALEGHSYTAFITQDSAYEYDETKSLPSSGTTRVYHDKDKNKDYASFSGETAGVIVEETKDAYLVVFDINNDTNKKKMVLKPTKIEKKNVTANLGGGYLESFHVDKDKSNFYNSVSINNERKVTYKLGEVTDTSILNSISKEEADGFTKLLAYAKADTKPLTTGSFNFNGGTYDTANIAKATGKISPDKYYYVYSVADTVNGKYVPVEDVVVFNGNDDGILTHFAFAGTQPSDPYTGDTNTTNPTNVTGDNSIATKKIPQTGATPVFMIVLGSVVLVAGIFVVANKKYRDIK